MTKKVFINGFGRIGRIIMRELYKRQSLSSSGLDLEEEAAPVALHPDIDVVGINDLVPASTSAYLLKYDTAYGPWVFDVQAKENAIVVGNKEIPYFMEKDPTKLPQAKLGTDVVIESTGVFRKKADASKHIAAGAKRVLVSAPMDDPDVTVVMGVNESMLKPEHLIVSNASCTTNCLAPLVKVLNDKLKIDVGLMTTVHAMTNDQRLLDQAHKDFTRARSAAFNIIPTTTGAAKAIGEVIPELKGKFNGVSIRVPVVTGSLVDFTAVVKENTTKEAINAMMVEAAEGPLKGILSVVFDEIVSSDIIGNAHSSIFDPHYTDVKGNLVKVLSWYDNECGYSNRCIDVIDKLL
nr:type I glyceraldehyde-3-phosphate dehydrogenase [Candidatus Sigynarchaeum springense]MDO8116512.1 type I glyceraldehyde-3-phosphate dehydrogenase [Candidatus Sigynarchaeota archaeon]